jgi:hypothetical protein
MLRMRLYRPCVKHCGDEYADQATSERSVVRVCFCPRRRPASRVLRREMAVPADVSGAVPAAAVHREHSHAGG